VMCGQRASISAPAALHAAALSVTTYAADKQQ
jgi:hypothetical protein